MTLWFVTPAFQRFELSAICFDQRREVIDRLADAGIEAHCVVIADDENLELARERGFDTVERDNTWLGRKFNDGMEYAGTHGAEWIVPIGSDSWIAPSYFLPLPPTGMTLTSAFYSVVTTDRLAELKVGKHGAGPYVIHRSRFATSQFRPAQDELRRFVDSSTIRGLAPLRWQWRDLAPLQYVGFRGHPHLTPYGTLWAAWGTAERDDPWTLLGQTYSPALVERARRALA